MAKFGMYTKGTNEANQHVSVVEVRTNMFVVREINNNINENKNLLLG